jgi:hypothetical protein
LYKFRTKINIFIEEQSTITSHNDDFADANTAMTNNEFTETETFLGFELRKISEKSG